LAKLQRSNVRVTHSLILFSPIHAGSKHNDMTSAVVTGAAGGAAAENDGQNEEALGIAQTAFAMVSSPAHMTSRQSRSSRALTNCTVSID